MIPDEFFAWFEDRVQPDFARDFIHFFAVRFGQIKNRSIARRLAVSLVRVPECCRGLTDEDGARDVLAAAVRDGDAEVLNCVARHGMAKIHGEPEILAEVAKRFDTLGREAKAHFLAMTMRTPYAEKDDFLLQKLKGENLEPLEFEGVIAGLANSREERTITALVEQGHQLEDKDLIGAYVRGVTHCASDETMTRLADATWDNPFLRMGIEILVQVSQGNADLEKVRDSYIASAEGEKSE